jgi:hypothetical protein
MQRDTERFKKDMPMVVNAFKLLAESFFGDMEFMMHSTKLVLTGDVVAEGMGILYECFWSDD